MGGQTDSEYQEYRFETKSCVIVDMAEARPATTKIDSSLKQLFWVTDCNYQSFTLHWLLHEISLSANKQTRAQQRAVVELGSPTTA
jgi:hypothetical protein